MLVDRGWSEIGRYSADGGFLNSTGREGEGPGEYRQIEVMKHAEGGTLLVLDFGGRVTVLGPDLTLLRTFDLPPFTRPIYPLDDGTMVVQVAGPFASGDESLDRLFRKPRALWRFRTTGERLDSIGMVAGVENYLAYGGVLSLWPLFGKASQVATSGGRVFQGESDEMQVEELSPAGDLVRVLRIRDFPLAITDAEVRAEREPTVTSGSGSQHPPPARPTRPSSWTLPGRCGCNSIAAVRRGRIQTHGRYSVRTASGSEASCSLIISCFWTSTRTRCWVCGGTSWTWNTRGCSGWSETDRRPPRSPSCLEWRLPSTRQVRSNEGRNATGFLSHSDADGESVGVPGRNARDRRRPGPHRRQRRGADHRVHRNPGVEAPFRFAAEPRYRHGANPGDYIFQFADAGRL